jgi:hypothetical protein
VLEDALARSDVRLSGFSVDVGSGGGAPSFAAGEQERGSGFGDVGTATATPAAADPAPTSDEPLGLGRLSVRV